MAEEKGKGKEEGEGSAMASKAAGILVVPSAAGVGNALLEAFAKVAVEKKDEVATVSELVRKLVSEGVAEEVAVTEALEHPVFDSPEKVVPEVAEEEESGGRMITLKSSDGKTVKVKEASARLSKTIGNIIDDGRGDEAIPLPDVSYKTLKKVVEYCDKHADEKSDTDEQKEELKNWDKAFIDELAEDDDSLVKVIMASNYLKIDGLHNLASQCKTTREQIGKA
jgi:S-phase kinase-associated protein 1